MKEKFQRFCEIQRNENLSSALQSTKNFISNKIAQKRPRTYPPIKWVYVRNKSYLNTDKEKLVYVNPNEITCETFSKMGFQLVEHGLVCSGKWDKATSDFHKRYKVHSLRRHFKAGTPWTETQYYNSKLSVVSEQGWRGCTSKNDLLHFLNRFDHLYEDIKNRGYKTQAELMKSKPQETERLNNDAKRPELNEIGINIGRHGDLLWHYGGQHRLCIAQLLKLDEVPVQVYARHRKWQDLREQVQKANSTRDMSQEAKNCLGHPDLPNITSSL